MRKLGKIFFLMSIMVITLTGTVFASGDGYIVKKELTYESKKTVPISSGFVEVLVGNRNFTQYQIDNEIVITPMPDEMREDEYGNEYAYFDVSGLRPGQKFQITITRDCNVTTYEALIPTRTDTVVNSETEMFLEPTEKIEADDPEIISKARELTEGITTDYKKAQAIFEYVNINMSYDESSSYANKGALSALKNLKGVCEEFTTLFIALCRAVNIPSRAIEGYKLEDNMSGDEYLGENLVNHVWAEIYLDEFGWVPVEPTVIYMVNGERRAYLETFCKMPKADYIAVGIYNSERANRRIKAVDEVKYEEILILKEEVVPEEQNKFEDISSYEWAAGAIQNLYSKNIISGYSENTFGPENNISRIEFMCMLSRLLKYYDIQHEEKGMVYYYPDYAETHWSKDDYDYLLRCYQIINPSDISSIGFDAITDVFGVGSINMNKPITRAEAVALMDVFLVDTNETYYFNDVNYDTTFRNSIIKAYFNGLINGYPDGSFKPDNPIRRAEAAVIFNRYIEGKIYIL